MSDEEADVLMERYRHWDNKNNRRDFINRMERKLSRREKISRF